LRGGALPLLSAECARWPPGRSSARRGLKRWPPIRQRRVCPRDASEFNKKTSERAMLNATLQGSLGRAAATAWDTATPGPAGPGCTFNGPDHAEESATLILGLVCSQAVVLVIVFVAVVTSYAEAQRADMRCTGRSKMAASGNTGAACDTIDVNIPLCFFIGPCMGRVLTDHGFIRQEHVRRSKGRAYWALAVPVRYFDQSARCPQAPREGL
jgi:hypothetical protein